jgi:hypothetical protein
MLLVPQCSLALDTKDSLNRVQKWLLTKAKKTWRELLELIYCSNQIKGKDDLLSDEFEKFISTNNVSNINYLQGLHYFFYNYITDPSVREMINQQDFYRTLSQPNF